MKKIFIIILAPIVFIACKKDTADDISGNETITGKLYKQILQDSLLKTIVTNQEIFLRKDTAQGVTNFLFSTKTDTSGNFIFKYLQAQKYYALNATLRADTRLDHNILFTVNNPVVLADSNVNLYLSPDFTSQNGLFVVCEDTVTFGGPLPSSYPGVLPGTIPFENIYIYTSRVIADADINYTGQGSAYSFTARGTGTALKMNLPAIERLYIKTAITYGTLAFRNILDSVELGETGLDSIIVYNHIH